MTNRIGDHLNEFSKNGESSRSQGVYLPTNPAIPRQCLNTDSAVSQWHTTPGYQAFWGWIKRRCERIRGKDILRGEYQGSSEGINILLKMLDSMMSWVREVPIQPQSNQRFGYLAFRTYIKLVEERLPNLFTSSTIPDHLLDQLLPLFLNSYAFGHPVRIDYGTGHELAFILGLWVCVVSGWIGGEGPKEVEEDELILRVFTKYLDLTTLLQKTYRLEPAGSHGVWGLDDYCFLPYLFGSAQLLGELAIDPSSSSAPPDDIKDLYTLSLYHLALFKTGAAFSEHSPMLHSLSQMPNWVKIHSGLRKMFTGEVTGKRVVVQGLHLGGWLWGEDLPEAGRLEGTNNGSIPFTSVGEGTKAPWAR
uniref:Serine/threonine-protein phosphatase 2A activator n=1 Tax=Kwoniella pini CBS 10737 TaxID=1296096 RepID=A0A1B9ICW6_9TREE|nr:serine/threonine-protein phosphatase 2A activator 1 [Kwoniella pini CBS 10737]OCF53307.1 serine/threonine-protein phosphatase 2A activator 1 [Kwoniella pini CBS 10737]